MFGVFRFRVFGVFWVFWCLRLMTLWDVKKVTKEGAPKMAKISGGVKFQKNASNS